MPAQTLKGGFDRVLSRIGELTNESENLQQAILYRTINRLPHATHHHPVGLETSRLGGTTSQ